MDLPLLSCYLFFLFFLVNEEKHRRGNSILAQLQLPYLVLPTKCKEEHKEGRKAHLMLRGNLWSELTPAH